jgi:hypothetical protein
MLKKGKEMFKLRHFFFLPSFYLLVTFTIAYILYLSDIIEWDKPPAELHFWCMVTILSAALSVSIYSGVTKNIINSPVFQDKLIASSMPVNLKRPLLLILLLIGILGIGKYILDYSKFLGAFGIFYSFFVQDTGQLRTLAENVESVGTQLSYFTWFAAFIITAEIAAKKMNNKWWSVVIFIILINSIFLDRTRPVWLSFTCALIYFIITYYKYSRKAILTFMSSIAVFFISIFILIGALLGKGADDLNYTKFNLPPSIQPIFLYLTSSFAYLGRLLYLDASCDYSPVRITYPIQKILARANLTEQPPNQVLEFFILPILTNVGTFLEPFFQDGGRVFLFLGIILHTFIFDKVVLHLLSNISQMAVIVIATLCFIDFIGFFVPKISSTATWFILLFAYLVSRLKPVTIG